MINQRGMSLIELIMFIIVIGIMASTVFIAFNTVLSNSSRPGDILKATQLANARMQLILLQRFSTTDFNTFTDPCASGTLAACQGLETYAAVEGFTVNSTITAVSGGVRTATITVTGNASSSVMMRFVE